MKRKDNDDVLTYLISGLLAVVLMLILAVLTVLLVVFAVTGFVTLKAWTYRTEFAKKNPTLLTLYEENRSKEKWVEFIITWSLVGALVLIPSYVVVQILVETGLMTTESAEPVGIVVLILLIVGPFFYRYWHVQRQSQSETVDATDEIVLSGKQPQKALGTSDHRIVPATNEVPAPQSMKAKPVTVLRPPPPQSSTASPSPSWHAVKAKPTISGIQTSAPTSQPPVSSTRISAGTVSLTDDQRRIVTILSEGFGVPVQQIKNAFGVDELAVSGALQQFLPSSKYMTRIGDLVTAKSIEYACQQCQSTLSVPGYGQCLNCGRYLCPQCMKTMETEIQALYCPFCVSDAFKIFPMQCLGCGIHFLEKQQLKEDYSDECPHCGNKLVTLVEQ